jgi:hypothetical protein
MPSDKGLEIKEVFDRSSRERFIPVTRKDLINGLVEDSKNDLPGEDQKHFAPFCELYGAVFHQRFHSLFEKIKKAYSPYSPDQEFVQFDAQTEEREQEFIDSFVHLLDRTNYERLGQKEMEELLEPDDSGGLFGLKMVVDIKEDYEWIHIYYRGSAKLEVTKKKLFGLLKPKEFVMDAFSRVVIFFKLKGDDKIAIKTFRQVPKDDLEMVLPTTQIRMRLIDKLLLAGTGAGGLAAVIVKLIKGGAGAGSKAGMIALFVGLGMAAMKVTLGYLRKKKDCREVVFRQLYFKNLANNLGVVSMLMDQAEEEETKEALLAWYFLRKAGKPLDEETLDQNVEKYVLDKYGFDADYESDDGLTKLQDEKLAEGTLETTMSAVPAEKAYEILDEYWDNIYSVDEASIAGKMAVHSSTD